MASTTEAVAAVRRLNGQRIGDGQCYALASWYLNYITPGYHISVSLGGWPAGFKTGAAWSAYAIGDDFNWRSINWHVADAADDGLQIGVIYTCKPNNGFFKTLGDGHVGIVTGLDANVVEVTEQNYNNNLTTNVRQWPRAGFAAGCRHFILPPDLAAGGKAESQGSTGGSGQAAQSTEQVIEASLFYVESIQKYAHKEIEIDNLWQKAMDIYQKTTQDFQTQKFYPSQDLLNPDFTEFGLKDFYGNEVVYSPNLFNNSTDKNKKWKVIMTGALGDTNLCKLYIKNYKGDVPGGERAIRNDLVIDYEENALVDSAAKNLTIINDSTATYLQSHKNQINAQKQTLNENGKLMRQQNTLRTSQMELANEKSLYSAQYATDIADLKRTYSAVDGGANVVSSLFNLQFGSALKAGYDGFKNWDFADRALTNSRQMQDFAAQEAGLNKQSTVLANHAAKLAQSQAERSLLAQLKDVENQPDTIQQLGDGIEYQTGNSVNDVYVFIRVPDKRAITRVNTYLRLFGATRQDQQFELRHLLPLENTDSGLVSRPMRYVKVSSLDLNNISIPKQLLDSLINIFMTGVRLWHYDFVKDKDIYPIQEYLRLKQTKWRE